MPTHITSRNLHRTHFKSYKKQIEPLVYDMGVMPAAKRTFENFWRSDAPKILDDQLFGGQVYQNPTGKNPSALVAGTFGKFRRPGRPIANIVGIPTEFGNKEIKTLGGFCFQGPIYSLMDTREGQRVRLSAQPTLFGAQFTWSFVHPETSCTDFSGPPLTGDKSAVVSFTLDPAINSDIKKNNPKPYHLRIAVTNEFAQLGSGFNEILVGRLFSNSALPALTFEADIHPLLVNPFPATGSQTPLSCVHCHSNGNVVNRADGIYNLMDFKIADPNQVKEFLYNMMMTRVDCRDPENSLILKKPAGHHHYRGTVQGFEDLTNPNSEFNLGNSGDVNNRAKILRWIMEGARYNTSAKLRQASCAPLILLRPHILDLFKKGLKRNDPLLIQEGATGEERELLCRKSNLR